MFPAAALRLFLLAVFLALAAGCSPRPVPTVDATTLRALEKREGFLKRMQGPMKISGVKVVYVKTITEEVRGFDNYDFKRDIYRLEDSEGNTLLPAFTGGDPRTRFDNETELSGLFVFNKGDSDKLESYQLTDIQKATE